MIVSIQNAERVVNLKTKRLVNALSPIEAAYGSDDEELREPEQPVVAQLEAASEGQPLGSHLCQPASLSAPPSPVPSPALKAADSSAAGSLQVPPVSPAASCPPTQLPVLSGVQSAELTDFPFNFKRGAASAATCCSSVLCRQDCSLPVLCTHIQQSFKLMVGFASCAARMVHDGDQYALEQLPRRFGSAQCTPLQRSCTDSVALQSLCQQRHRCLPVRRWHGKSAAAVAEGRGSGLRCLLASGHGREL